MKIRWVHWNRKESFIVHFFPLIHYLDNAFICIFYLIFTNIQIKLRIICGQKAFEPLKAP